MSDFNDNLHNHSKASTYELARSLRRSETKAEQILWKALRNSQVCKLKFRRQHPFENYILDFYNHEMKLVIEVDGEVHNDPEVEDYDKIRSMNLKENGLTVLRFTNNEVENDLEAVLKKIEGWVEQTAQASFGSTAETQFPSVENDNTNNEFAASLSPFSSRRGVGSEINRLDKLFSEKKHNILNIYCTAGFPQLDSTLKVITALAENGADIIELGIPYSDPIADGPVIQQSNMQALENGMNISLLFEQLKDTRQYISIPIILMGYMNPVLQFGFHKFCVAAAAAGVDGIILPDLPIHEFETEYEQHFKKHGLKFIFLVTPETSIERIRKIDSLCTGFLYAVSSSSTTGNTQKSIPDQGAYYKKLKDMNLKNPVLVGFGIQDKHTFNAACTYTNGAIIGSAYINAVKNTGDIYQTTKDFINSIKG